MNRPTEIALALALAVVLLPVMLLIALLVRLALGRPVIHRSMRAGVRGRRFELIKFRTMPPGAGGGVTGGAQTCQGWPDRAHAARQPTG